MTIRVDDQVHRRGVLADCANCDARREMNRFGQCVICGSECIVIRYAGPLLRRRIKLYKRKEEVLEEAWEEALKEKRRREFRVRPIKGR